MRRTCSSSNNFPPRRRRTWTHGVRLLLGAKTATGEHESTGEHTTTMPPTPISTGYTIFRRNTSSERGDVRLLLGGQFARDARHLARHERGGVRPSLTSPPRPSSAGVLARPRHLVPRSPRHLVVPRHLLARSPPRSPRRPSEVACVSSWGDSSLGTHATSPLAGDERGDARHLARTTSYLERDRGRVRVAFHHLVGLQGGIILVRRRLVVGHCEGPKIERLFLSPLRCGGCGEPGALVRAGLVLFRPPRPRAMHRTKR